MSWKDNLAIVDAAVAGFFDEDACRAFAMARPARSPNAAVAADVTRPSFPFQGTIEIDPSFSAMSNHSEPTPSDRFQRQVERTCLTALSTAWPWMPRKDDQVVCGGVRYVLAANPERDGTDRVVLWLSRAKD